MRTSIRHARLAITNDPESDQTKKTVAEATHTIDRMVTRGLVHDNSAARYKSRLVKRHNKSSKPAGGAEIKAESSGGISQPVESPAEETPPSG